MAAARFFWHGVVTWGRRTNGKVFNDVSIARKMWHCSMIPLDGLFTVSGFPWCGLRFIPFLAFGEEGCGSPEIEKRFSRGSFPAGVDR
jgi:hypothetical protein